MTQWLLVALAIMDYQLTVIPWSLTFVDRWVSFPTTGYSDKEARCSLPWMTFGHT